MERPYVTLSEWVWGIVLTKLRIISVVLIFYFTVALAQLLWVELSQLRISVKDFITRLNSPNPTYSVAKTTQTLIDLTIKSKIGSFDKKVDRSNFIRVTTSGQAIEIINENAQAKGKIFNFALGDNPCKNRTPVLISALNFQEFLEVKSEIQRLSIPLEIHRLSSQTIIIGFAEESQTYKIPNGDTQDLFAEVNNIMFGDV